MCRNIRPLHNFEPPATDEEVRAAALQYVRKISGSTKPSQANEAAFDHAIEAVAAASRELLDELTTTAPPKDREVEAEKRRARSAQRSAAWADCSSAAASASRSRLTPRLTAAPSSGEASCARPPGPSSLRIRA